MVFTINIILLHEINPIKWMNIQSGCGYWWCCFFAGNAWVLTWWCHQMEKFSALLAICAENSPVADEFPSQSPVTLSFDVFFDLRLNEWLSKQWWGWWFEMPSRPLWLHFNELHLPCSNRSLISAWINCWGNTCEAGELRHHHAHYDVTVMSMHPCISSFLWVIELRLNMTDDILNHIFLKEIYWGSLITIQFTRSQHWFR